MEVDVKLKVFLTSVIDGGEWSLSRSVRFLPGKWPVQPFYVVLHESYNRTEIDGEKNISVDATNRYPIAQAIFNHNQIKCEIIRFTGTSICKTERHLSFQFCYVLLQCKITTYIISKGPLYNTSVQ
jgi:hypothetical protein